MRDIESCFDDDAPPVGKLHTQTAACRRCSDQFYRQQLFDCSCHAACAFPVAIIVQCVKSQTTRFAKRLPPQPALFKIPYQAFRFCLAQTTSCNNLSRIPHASTSTCNHAREKSGFGRMATLDLSRLSYSASNLKLICAT